jgi:hypothetical protein
MTGTFAIANEMPPHAFLRLDRTGRLIPFIRPVANPPYRLTIGIAPPGLRTFRLRHDVCPPGTFEFEGQFRCFRIVGEARKPKLNTNRSFSFRGAEIPRNFGIGRRQGVSSRSDDPPCGYGRFLRRVRIKEAESTAADKQAAQDSSKECLPTDCCRGIGHLSLSWPSRNLYRVLGR